MNPQGEGGGPAAKKKKKEKSARRGEESCLGLYCPLRGKKKYLQGEGGGILVGGGRGRSVALMDLTPTTTTYSLYDIEGKIEKSTSQ